MHVSILTPDASAFEGQARQLTLPGLDGSFQILDHHAPMVALLARGAVVVEGEGRTEQFVTTGGLVEVRDNRVAILADSIIR